MYAEYPNEHYPRKQEYHLIYLLQYFSSFWLNSPELLLGSIMSLCPPPDLVP